MKWVLHRVNFEASGGIANSLTEAFFVCDKVLRSVLPAPWRNIISISRVQFFTAVVSGGNTSDPLSYQNIPFPFD